MFVRAIYYRPNKTVHYFDENGEETLYIGGSFAWRTNNPGNLARPGKRVISTSIGLAQRTSDPKSLFLIFPNKESGDAERIRLLKEVYGKSTIAQMIERYAPRHENDTDGYIAKVCEATGVESDTILKELDDTQFKRLAGAMAKHEGWIPGKIVPLGKPKTVTVRDNIQQPMASQAVKLDGASIPVTAKTDAVGTLPLIYPKLFNDNVSLILDGLGEKIGDIVASAEVRAYTFVAPYFAAKSNSDVHTATDKLSPIIHIVKKNETLGTIASQHQVSVEAIAALNNIRNPDKISARQHLRIPLKGTGRQERPGRRPSPATQRPASTQVRNGSAAKLGHTTHAQSRVRTGVVSVDQQRTDKNHPITVVSTPVKQPSGREWCARFRGDSTLNGLAPGFREKVSSFLGAMKAAGVSVRINAVLRPVERSYLMYYAFQICRKMDVTTIPPWPGVYIDWAHRDGDGKPNIAKAREAAADMCRGYGIRPASLLQKVAKPGRSNHSQGLAIDMNLNNYLGKRVKDAAGNVTEVKSFSTLALIGASYGVKYYPQENMHWSHNGR